MIAMLGASPDEQCSVELEGCAYDTHLGPASLRSLCNCLCVTWDVQDDSEHANLMARIARIVGPLVLGCGMNNSFSDDDCCVMWWFRRRTSGSWLVMCLSV
jgi:hypothetical protein